MVNGAIAAGEGAGQKLRAYKSSSCMTQFYSACMMVRVSGERCSQLITQGWLTTLKAHKVKLLVLLLLLVLRLRLRLRVVLLRLRLPAGAGAAAVVGPLLLLGCCC